MKILDPQSALLTIAEVHQFLKSNPSRQKDKKIGSYDTVNVVDHHLVRRDVEHYTQLVHPQIMTYPPASDFMRQLLVSLKRYELTKTEVYTLINLGVGLGPAPATTSANANVKNETNGEDGSNVEEEEVQESDLNKSLFRLIVEESDERFPGEEGEQQIDEILNLIKECIQGGRQEDKINGHNDNNYDASGNQIKIENP